MGSELPHEWDKNIQLYCIEVKLFRRKNLSPKIPSSRPPAQSRDRTEILPIFWLKTLSFQKSVKRFDQFV